MCRKTPFIAERQHGLWCSLFKSQCDCSHHACMQLHVAHDFATCKSLPSCLLRDFRGHCDLCKDTVPWCHLGTLYMACHLCHLCHMCHMCHICHMCHLCLRINFALHAPAMKELTMNHRQSSDTTWSMFSIWRDFAAIKRAWMPSMTSGRPGLATDLVILSVKWRSRTPCAA